MNKKRRLFDKEGFGEGNRQKFVWVFLACMFVVLGFDAAGRIHEVTAYLTFLSFLAGSFILGYSGSETMKLFRASSTEQDVNENVDQRESVSGEYVEKTPRPKDLDGGCTD